MTGPLKYMGDNFKQKLHNILELSHPGNRIGRIFDGFMICLIIANVIAIVLESEEDLHQAYGDFFNTFDAVSVAIFTIEYVLRVWSCTVNKAAGYDHPVFGRLKYMSSPIAIIDLLAFAPFYIHAIYAIDLRILRIFRLLRLLKLTRYSPALSIIWTVIVSQRRALTAWLLIIGMAMIFSSSIVYLFEHKAQPERFGSIPDAMWWAITTLSTTGYGDAVPVTGLGRIFGAITMLMGICMVALPTGVIATGFADEIKKHDFVINWRLVSMVPLFSRLDAVQIADIASLLTPLIVPPKFAIVRIDEEADSMFFIVSGKVEIEKHPHPVFLAEGDFFGEIGLLKKRRRTAAVVALTQCRLLELKASDFWELADKHPSLRENVETVADLRLGQLDSDDTDNS
jgi:voltage-gated potassium channel